MEQLSMNPTGGGSTPGFPDSWPNVAKDIEPQTRGV